MKKLSTRNSGGIIPHSTLLLTTKIKKRIYLTMAELGQTLGAAGNQSMTAQTTDGQISAGGAEPTASTGRIRVFREVLPPLPKIPGWPMHTDDVVSDTEWAVLGPDLEAYENGSAREHLVRAGGTLHSGSF